MNINQLNIIIMKKIYEWALNQIGATANENLIKAINMLDETKQENFVDVIIGIDIDDSQLAKKIVVDSVVYTLDSTNYLNGDVYGRYMGEDVRYFATQEDADTYASTGEYSWSKSTSYASDDKYPIKGVHSCPKSKWFSYDTWMNAEVVVEENK